MGITPAKKHINNKLERFINVYSLFNQNHAKVQELKINDEGWVNDELSNECFLCASKFSMFNRKHHCRLCGLLVCGYCSSKKIRCTKDMTVSLERSCDKCFNKALSQTELEKVFNYENEKQKMIPIEFMRMILMEKTKKGSYKEYKNKLEEQKDYIFINPSNSNQNIVGVNNINDKNSNNNKSDFDSKEESNNTNIKKHRNAKSEITVKKTNLDVNNNNNNNPANHQKRKSLMASFFSSKYIYCINTDRIYLYQLKYIGNKEEENNNGLTQEQNDKKKAAEDNISKANAQARVNLEKTKILADKSVALKDQAADFNALAKKLAEKKW